MHRQVASLLSTRSPGRLALLGTELGKRDIDIATTGGAEWMHSGPVTLMIKDDWVAGSDDHIRPFAEVMQEQKIPWLVFRTIEFELKHVPGSLGRAATALDDINIYAVTILETSGDSVIVGLGVRPSQVGDAIARLKQADYDARLRRHPDDPAGDDWWDEWDERTERLLPDFDKKISPNDRRFYELKRRVDRGARRP